MSYSNQIVNTSYGYYPIETEYCNNSNNQNSNRSNEFKNSIKRIEMFRFEEGSENIELSSNDENSNDYIKNMNILLKNKKSLESLRISNSISNNENDNILQKVEFIPDVFNESNVESKSLIISNLEINISHNENITKENYKNEETDFKTKLENSLKKYFEKKKLNNTSCKNNSVSLKNNKK